MGIRDRATSSGDYQGNSFHKLAHIHDGIYGNAKSWISNTPGRGMVTLELKAAVTIDRIVWSRDRGETPPNFADRVASDYTLETSVDGTTWKFAAGSQDRVPVSAVAGGTLWLLRPGLKPTAASRLEEREKELAGLRAEVAGLGRGKTAYTGRLSNPGPPKQFQRGGPPPPTRGAVRGG